MLITSYARSKKIPGEKWSTAVYQPEGFSYPKAHWMDIRDHAGEWIRPREFLAFPRPLEAYFVTLWQHYLNRKDKVEEWVNLASDEAILCCWCPYERAAQRQLKEHGSYVCHTAVVGYFLNYNFKVPIEYDNDRERMVRFDL